MSASYDPLEVFTESVLLAWEVDRGASDDDAHEALLEAAAEFLDWLKDASEEEEESDED